MTICLESELTPSEALEVLVTLQFGLIKSQKFALASN